MAEGEDRTEAPSAKRLEQARRDGNVAISREAGLLASLGLAGGTALLVLPAIVGGLQRTMRAVLCHLDGIDVASGGLAHVLGLLAWHALLPMVPMLLAAMIGTVASTLLQSGLLLRPQALIPDISRVSPLRGVKRVFGGHTLAEALKSAVKLCAFALAVWLCERQALPSIAALAGLDGHAILLLFGRLLRQMVIGLLGVQLTIALFDIGWMRMRRTAKLRMSRQDLRDEHKESEGDPHLKARLRALRHKRSRRRMLDAVPAAAVVITNPTHYAVALAYERGGNAAPRIVAKGVDEVAARIREVARQNRVPLVPNPPLARALHKLELDAEIPREHFQAVAAIIAFVWRQQRRPPVGQSAIGAPVQAIANP